MGSRSLELGRLGRHTAQPCSYLPVLLCPALLWTSFARSPGKPSLGLAMEMDPRAQGTLEDLGTVPSHTPVEAYPD